MAHYDRWLPLTSSRLSNYDRVKVDPAQTSFFEGREFRSFLEFDLAQAAELVLRVSCNVDFILFAQTLESDQGHVRFEASQGGTVGGTFSNSLPIIGKNRLPTRRTPYYESQMTLTTGGTYTGGTLLEVLACKADTNTNQAQSVGAGISDERGLPAGTYYLKFIGVTATKGRYRLWWEERPAGV